MIDNRLSLFIKDIISDKIIYTPATWRRERSDRAIQQIS